MTYGRIGDDSRVPRLPLSAGGHRIREPRKLGFEAEVCPNPVTIQERVESACALSVRAVGRRRAHRREQCRKIGRLIIGHVVNPMRSRGRIDQASHSLCDVSVMPDRQALSWREAAHHRNDLLDMRVTVAIHERESQHPYIETFDLQEKALRGKFAHGVCQGWRAGIILAGESTPIRTVDQSGARKDEAPHRSGAGRVGQLSRADIINRMRLLGTRAAKECRAASAIAALSVNEYDRDRSLVAIPRPEIQIVARFGPSARNGLDIHAMGAQQRVRRKLIRAGQRAVTVRLHLGAAEAVLGVPASAITGRVLALDDLWGEAPTRPLLDQLATARAPSEATAILETAIAERLTSVNAGRSHSPLALRATERLTSATVKTVAADLGVSERQLRRVFLQTIGVTPKAYARLARFRRALRTAREDRHITWASIAATAGYYDQAHLIEDFHSIAGVTPRTLLAELGLTGSGPSFTK